MNVQRLSSKKCSKVDKVDIVNPSYMVGFSDGLYVANDSKREVRVKYEFESNALVKVN